jgi:aquaporin Z
MAVAGKSELAPLAIGITLMVMSFSGAHISGGHFNPVVTLGVWVNHGLPGNRMLCYFLVQCSAGVAAAFVAEWLLPGRTAILPVCLSNWRHVVLAEVLGTFALVYTVLNVTFSGETSSNIHYGMAVGFAFTAMAYALGRISGGFFNPALAVGLYLTGHMSGLALLTYVAGHFAGAVFAALVFWVTDEYGENKNFVI